MLGAERRQRLASESRGTLGIALPIELFALYLLGAYVTAKYPEQFVLELMLGLSLHAVATILAVVGGARLALAKGRPAVLGLLGVLSVLGIGILALISDREEVGMGKG